MRTASACDHATVWPMSPRLAANPFRDGISADLFFRTRQHEEAIIKVRCGIEDRHALILLTGASGTGKTLVSQVVCRGLPATAFLPLFIGVHPGMGSSGLLAAMAREMGIESVPRTTAAILAQLQERILDLHEAGKRPVFVVDEAHFLKSDGLHILRTLSNLESEEEKLVTVLLIAEEPFLRRLQSPAHASLRGRITFLVHLSPLTPEEAEQLIKYRLLKCKAPLNMIEHDVYPACCRLAGGIPRELLRLLYNAYVEAVAAGGATVTMAMLRRAATKLHLAGDQTGEGA